MQFRIQRECHARIAVIVLATSLGLFPTVLRAGGEDPPHGRPDIGGDVALRAAPDADGRGGRPEGRTVAPREARVPLAGIEAAIERWLGLGR